MKKKGLRNVKLANFVPQKSICLKSTTTSGKKNHFGPLPLLECEKDEVHIKESTSFLNVEEGGTRSRV
jgi:hypothetical protein